MNACVCSCKNASVTTLNPFLDQLLQQKLSPEEFDSWSNKPTNDNGLRFYYEEKEYLYPGKTELRKYERIGDGHRKTDDDIWKITEQILDDVVAKCEGEEHIHLKFEDDEEFREKRNYKSRANNPESNVTCAYCFVKFKNDESLKQHVSKGKNTKCYKKHRLSGLPAKLEKRQEDAKKPLGCDHCGKRYVTKASLQKHITGVHTNIQP